MQVTFLLRGCGCLVVARVFLWWLLFFGVGRWFYDTLSGKILGGVFFRGVGDGGGVVRWPGWVVGG